MLKEDDIKYLEKLYQSKNHWAIACNSTTFTANAFTTSRNESWHSRIKRSLSSFNEIGEIVKRLLEIDGNNIYQSEKSQIVNTIISFLI